MSIFGYLGPLAANGISRPEDGDSVYASKRVHFGPADGTPCSVSGPGIAVADGLVAVVQGSVRIEGETHGPESAARVLLDLYQQLGARCLERVSGRYALVIIDRRNRSALLAIDPMGVERLAYAVQGDSLVFGTSAEQVARATGGARLNRQAVFDYLVHHMVPAPITIFEGVHKLRAGNCAVFETGRIEAHRYWNPVFREDGPADDAMLAGQLRAALRTAVRDAHPDAEAGAFLSGGLDSSTVAGILSEVSPGHAQTFSIGFSYPEYDERHYARLANARFGTSGHEHVVMGDDIAAAFPLIARAYDEPFGNSSALPAYYCAKLARSHGVTHLLAGDGGDELFGGNSRYARQAFFQRYQKLPSTFRRHLLEPLLRNWPAALVFSPIRKARNYVERANIPLPRRLELWNLTYRLGAENVLHPDFMQSVDAGHAERQMDELWESAPCAHSLNRMLYFDWQYTLADNDLRKVETMSALAGVRVSYPMLHPDVIDVATRVPPSLMLPGTKLRDFYKRAMSGFLPDEIINKPKHGFGLPFGLWLQDSPPLRELILGNLSDLQKRQIIHPQLLDRLLHLHGKDDAEYYGVFVWVLAMLEQWLTEHGVAA